MIASWIVESQKGGGKENRQEAGVLVQAEVGQLQGQLQSEVKRLQGQVQQARSEEEEAQEQRHALKLHLSKVVTSALQKLHNLAEETKVNLQIVWPIHSCSLTLQYVRWAFPQLFKLSSGEEKTMQK